MPAKKSRSASVKKSGASGGIEAPKPKKPTTAYSFFIKENQNTVKVEVKEGERVLAERSKALGNLWREMDEDDRAPYSSKAERDKLRYKKEMEVFKANNPSASKKKTKDPTAPKKYLTAFFFFSNKNRSLIKADNPEKSVGDISKVLGERWREMKPAEKAPFNEEARRDRERYDYELDLWKKGKFNREEEERAKASTEEEDDDEDYSDAED